MDDVRNCEDPCVGKPGLGSHGDAWCPGTQATHPAYFELSNTHCSGATRETTVTWTRAPQLKPNCANDKVSYCTLVEVEGNALLTGTGDCIKSPGEAAEMEKISLAVRTCQGALLPSR